MIIPFEFVLEELAALQPLVRPMFGTFGIYVRGQIVFAVRERAAHPRDNGVWVATSEEHHESLRRELPSLRSIEMFGGDGPSGWQVLSVQSEDFEAEVLRACQLVLGGDARIGKTPRVKRARAAHGSTAARARVSPTARSKAGRARPESAAPSAKRNSSKRPTTKSAAVAAGRTKPAAKVKSRAKKR